MRNLTERKRDLIAQLRAYRRKHGAIPGSRALGYPFKHRVRRAFGTWNAAIAEAFGSAAVKRRLSDSEVLERIRSYAQETKKRPTSKNVGDTFGRVARERFGSWNKAVEMALGLPPLKVKRSDDDLLEILRGKYAALGRLPLAGDVESITTRLWKRFGGLNEALEQAVGTSVRLEVLRSLKALTPPGCDVASSHEISEYLKSKRSMRFDVHQVGSMLETQHRAGLVEKSAGDVRPTWRLTAKGQEFLRTKEKQYARRRT